MNKGRYYETFKGDNVKITKYWLLGFIEGEGSFNFGPFFRRNFYEITRKKGNKKKDLQLLLL
jgi:hypothetical protein